MSFENTKNPVSIGAALNLVLGVGGELIYRVMCVPYRHGMLVIALFGCLVIGYGCGTSEPYVIKEPYRMHPEFYRRALRIKTPGLIAPDVRICELTAGGVRELRDDWGAAGRQNVADALTACLDEQACRVKTCVVGKEIEEELEDIQTLYRAVSQSIQIHTYGPYPFPEKRKNFIYSVGAIEDLLQRLEADALIFVYGYDEISTVGRKALTVLGVAIGAVTGVMVLPTSGMTSVSVGLVDRSGAILWYNVKASAGIYDLRKPESAKTLLKDILSDLPRLGI